jgi:hypothetical protein
VSAGVKEVIQAIRRGRGRPLPELEATHRTIEQELRGRPAAGSTRPLLIGQAPGPRTHPDLPLVPTPTTSAGGRLFAMTGLSTEDYMRTFDRVNLLYEHPGKMPAKAQDAFPVREARAAANAMHPFLSGREVLFVGRDVTCAFGHEDMEWCRWYWDTWGMRFAAIPHPSGRNHWYNKAENRAAAETFLREWVGHLTGVAFSPRREDDQPR